MEMYLSELIDKANECLKNLGLLSGTIDDYQCSAFRPIERRLGNPLITSTDILIDQEDFFNGLYNSGDISRQTLNWVFWKYQQSSRIIYGILLQRFQKIALKAWMMSSVRSGVSFSFYAKTVYMITTSGCCFPLHVAEIVRFVAVFRPKR